MSITRQSYPSDVSDDEWAFVAPYLTLLGEHALQRKHDLREVYNALCWLVRTGAQWRMLPHDFPRWEAVYQQTQRWLRAGRFEAIAHDLRLLLRLAARRSGQPSAVILDARTVQSTPESGTEAGYDGHTRRKGRKVHLAVDTLGYLLATLVTPANEQERAQVAELAALVQAVTGQTVELAYVDQGYTGEEPAQTAAAHGSSWSWYVCLRRRGPSVASCSCRVAGWSSAALLGWRASAVWRVTMSGCQKPWRG